MRNDCSQFMLWNRYSLLESGPRNRCSDFFRWIGGFLDNCRPRFFIATFVLVGEHVKKTIFLSLLVSMIGVGQVQGQMVTFDFESDPSRVIKQFGHSEWRASGGKEGGGYLSITDPLFGQRGAIQVSPLFEGVLNGAFSIKADLRVGGGTQPPADGFSFNFVRPDDPLVDTGTGFAASPDGEANLSEEGSTTGLGIGFDEWQTGLADQDATEDDCGSVEFDCVGISVRIDGELIKQVPFPVLNGALEDKMSLQTGEDQDLSIEDIERNPSRLGWAPFEINMSADNNLMISYKGREVINEVVDYERHEGTFIFGGRTGGAYAAHHIDNLSVTIEDGLVGVAGDFNGNGERDPADLDMLAAAAADDASFDLTSDGAVNAADRKEWVEVLTNTYFGDSNFDGEFSSSDFVAVFGTAKYETGNPATWAEGDWNGDGFFNSTDFVAAFAGGGYELGARDGGLAVVPEPSSLGLILCGALGLLGIRRRR